MESPYPLSPLVPQLGKIYVNFNRRSRTTFKDLSRSSHKVSWLATTCVQCRKGEISSPEKKCWQGLIDIKTLGEGRDRSLIYCQKPALEIDIDFHHFWDIMIALVRWLYRIGGQWSKMRSWWWWLIRFNAPWGTPSLWLTFRRHRELYVKCFEAETKWPQFFRLHFEMDFLEWKCMNFH